MKSLIPVVLLILWVGSALAQKQTDLIAVTDEIPDGKAWVSLRTVQSSNLQSRLLISNNSYKSETATSSSATISKALCSGSAAIGFDGTTNRIFYITAIKGDLRYFDTKNGNSVNQVTNIYTSVAPDLDVQNGPENQAFIFTRMAMSADGFMYALTNNGKIFIRFNPTKPENIESLGPVAGFENADVLAGENSWGGDMIADTEGNLIVFSAKGHVFRVNTTTRQANFIGQLQNMPEQFVVSGAAVQEDGSILISSSGGAVRSAILHSLDLLKLTPSLVHNLSFNSGDLASAYQYPTTGTKAIATPDATIGGFAIGPNPVVNGRFQISLANGQPEGNYQIELVSLSGNRVYANTRYLSAGKFSNTLQVQNIPAGMYILKLYNTQHKTHHAQKVVFQ
jgi:hypothetical protein